MDPLNLVLGIYDDPDHQTQKNYSVDLLRNNIAVLGSAMSGKTTLLKTLLIRLHQIVGITKTEEIYILDFSNNLEVYKELPYVVAYFDSSQEENIRRIFKIVEERYAHNIRALPGKSYIEYKPESLPENDEPRHITFILDGLNVFMAEDRYTVYHEVLQKLMRDGLSKGVSVVFTANDSSNGVNRLITFCNSIIAFDLPNEKYSELFNKKIEKPVNTAGRGIVNVNADVYEFQAYFPYNLDDINYSSDMHHNDENAVKEVISKLVWYHCTAGHNQKEQNESILESCIKRKLKTFTSDLTKSEWEKYVGITWEEYSRTSNYASTEFIAGLDYYSLEPIKIDLLKARTVAIYGKKSSGKTNLLSLILETAKKIPGVHFVFWEDGRHGLTRNAKPVERVIHSLTPNQYTWIEDRESFENFIRNSGYYDLPRNVYRSLYIPPEESSQSDLISSQEIFEKRKVYPYTVFVIQSRLFYQQIAGNDNDQLISRLAPFICNEDLDNPKIFIFSDVQRITNNEICTVFNNSIDHAFLLYDILRFINDRGQKSVFGTLDQIELKERFGKCEIGDGFYLNLELDEISKLKFIKQI